MKTIKNALYILLAIVSAGLLFILITFFIKFRGGFSDNPEHWYAAGSFIVSFLTLVVTIIIAIYVYEITRQSTRIPVQREIYNNIKSILTEYRMFIFKDQPFNEVMLKTSGLMERLKDFQGEADNFNNHRLYESAMGEFLGELAAFYFMLVHTLTKKASEITQNYQITVYKLVTDVKEYREKVANLSFAKNTLLDQILESMK